MITENEAAHFSDFENALAAPGERVYYSNTNIIFLCNTKLIFMNFCLKCIPMYHNYICIHVHKSYQYKSIVLCTIPLVYRAVGLYLHCCLVPVPYRTFRLSYHVFANWCFLSNRRDLIYLVVWSFALQPGLNSRFRRCIQLKTFNIAYDWSFAKCPALKIKFTVF